MAPAVQPAPPLHRVHGAAATAARSTGILPIAKKYKVAANNWGFVAGKTQTILPWDSWQKPYVAKERPDLTEEPPVWFHEVFRTDGRPYLEREVQLIRELTGTPFPR